VEVVMDSKAEFMEDEIEEIEEIEEPEKTPKNKTKKSPTNTILIVIIVLLVLQVAFTGYNTVNHFITDQQDIAQKAQVINEVAQYAANIDGVTRQMLDNYKKDVYNNQEIDSIGKQQVLATEYTFMGLMLLSQQNAKLMQTIALLK
jgi:uncharacterized protein HemX